MSKFCNNCGCELEDDAVFCPNCGAQDAPAEPVAEEQAPVETAAVAPDKKNLMTLIIVGAALVVAVVLMIVAFGSTPKKALNNLEKVLNGNAGKLSSLAPNGYWKYLKEEEDVTKADVKDEFKDSYEDQKEFLEEAYGKNVKYNLKLTDKDKLSKKKLEALAENIEDNYDIDEKKVKAAYELEVEMTIKGREDDDETETTMYAVKIGGKWYIVGSDGTFFPDSYV